MLIPHHFTSEQQHDPVLLPVMLLRRLLLFPDRENRRTSDREGKKAITRGIGGAESSVSPRHGLDFAVTTTAAAAHIPTRTPPSLCFNSALIPPSLSFVLDIGKHWQASGTGSRPRVR